MALAATLLPSGRVRSVMDRMTLGLARAGSLTSSETYGNDDKYLDLKRSDIIWRGGGGKLTLRFVVYEKRLWIK